MNRKLFHIKGMLGEYYALVYLRCKGYRCIKHRYKTPVGEVDLLVTKSPAYTRRLKSPNRLKSPITLILVEVKVRQNMSDALYAITDTQKRRYINAGKYLHKKYRGANIRYDAVLISGFTIKHIENAWV